MPQIIIHETVQSQLIEKVVDAYERADKLSRRVVHKEGFLKSHPARCRVWLNAELNFFRHAGLNSSLFDFSVYRGGEERFATQACARCAGALRVLRRSVIQQFRPGLASWQRDDM